MICKLYKFIQQQELREEQESRQEQARLGPSSGPARPGPHVCFINTSLVPALLLYERGSCMGITSALATFLKELTRPYENSVNYVNIQLR